MIYGLKNSYLVNTVYFLVVCLLRREFDIKKCFLTVLLKNNMDIK